jgi:hypothetical protein
MYRYRCTVNVRVLSVICKEYIINYYILNIICLLFMLCGIDFCDCTYICCDGLCV